MASPNSSRRPVPGEVIDDLPMRKMRIRVDRGVYFGLLATLQKGYGQSDNIEGIFLPYNYNEPVDTDSGDNPLYYFVCKDLFFESGFDMAFSGMLEVIPRTANVSMCALLSPQSAFAKNTSVNRVTAGSYVPRITTDGNQRIIVRPGNQGKVLYVGAIAAMGGSAIWLTETKGTTDMSVDVGNGKGAWLVAEENDDKTYGFVDALGRKASFVRWTLNDLGAY
ncbi:MAG: hypothetical protein NC548_32345 [Lachnospiraceae bacterium]|nr:hypothetical protein [Lachnospiraceae bacterium]